MSRQILNAYRRKLAKLHAVSGSLNEGVLSHAFGGLLESWGKSLDLTLVNQWEGKGPRGNDIRVDGALVPAVLRIPFGYWEAKDSKDDLNREIARKVASGYPDDNIIYEDTRIAVLRQDGKEIRRAPLQGDDEALLELVACFFAYERAEIAEFRRAAAQFRADLPQILEALRAAIIEAEKSRPEYQKAAGAFLDHAREVINPQVSSEDVREMLMQHILTEEIFTHVFDSAAYHRENNVARKLTELESTFFTGAIRHASTQRLAPYYNAIRHAASGIADRREKQNFLKRLYEDFYKVYNPKAADRLGVVYTPGEIVRFMIEGAEWLCERHFDKTLLDPGVEILDPATGTGTFIAELLEHFQGNHSRLRQKYQEELHANEVAILPYYVANLNIEATFAAITGAYAEFPGLVFVDTLDNTAGLGIYKGYQPDMFGSVSDENMGRIKRQNDRKISVIIGNPPYNAWQSNYNSQNANRPYKRVDDRIAQTYSRLSRAQNKSPLSDMYVRFYRWASDRLRDEGVLAIITNRNFIEKLAFDGFRKVVADEFSEIWIMDLGGDVRANPSLSGTRHNVFGIQTGVAIAFMVRTKAGKKFALRYARRPEDEPATDKLAFLNSNQLEGVLFEELRPDERGNWLNQSMAEWDQLLPLVDAKAGPKDKARPPQAIFRLTSNGVQTKRDEWVYSREKSALAKKMQYFVAAYRQSLSEKTRLMTVKWDREITKLFVRKTGIKYSSGKIQKAAFRPFVERFIYFDKAVNAFQFRLSYFYRDGSEPNPTITYLGKASSNPLAVFVTDKAFDTSLLKAGNGSTQGVARYRFTSAGARVDNITDWALRAFQDHYANETSDGSPITKDGIFAYVYAALYDPVYRELYADDLRRDFPRIPLYPNFRRWAEWGELLINLHLNYKDAAPWGATRVDRPSKRAAVPKLRSRPADGVIVIDSITELHNVPGEAWEYRLGKRSAVDWVLDQFKAKKIDDPTLAAHFDTYRFADYKEDVINLLQKVIRVSIETVEITRQIEAEPRSPRPLS